MNYIVKQFDSLAAMEHYLNVDLPDTHSLLQMSVADSHEGHHYVCIFKKGKK